MFSGNFTGSKGGKKAQFSVSDLNVTACFVQRDHGFHLWLTTVNVLCAAPWRKGPEVAGAVEEVKPC